jgi:hypothetical protein
VPSILGSGPRRGQLVYVAAGIDIDGSGGIKTCFRVASDERRLRLDYQGAPGCGTMEASNSAILARLDYKRSLHP